MTNEDKNQMAPSEKSSAPPDPEAKPVDVQALRNELEEQSKLARHNLDQWKRAAADFENYRKRVDKERAELSRFGAAGVLKSLLPILDDFERALATCPDVCCRLTWTEGVVLIERRLRLGLEQQGLREIEALGKPFDPAQHEAFLEEETEAYPDGHVSAILQKGYNLHERVLRPAMVKVARNKQVKVTEEATTAQRPQPTASEPATDQPKTNQPGQTER